jgi:hypothetical protein
LQASADAPPARTEPQSSVELIKPPRNSPRPSRSSDAHQSLIFAVAF